MFDFIVSALGEAWWSYPLILFVAAFDVVFPLLPSETIVITAGITAGLGELVLPLVLMMAAVGAFGGDNLAYWIGRRFQRLARRWLLRGEKGRRSLEWADQALRRYGGSLVIVGRFIPGGRTVTTVGSGLLDYPWRRFVGYDAIGASTWATTVSMIGYLGGRTFRDQPLLAFALSFGTALGVAAGIELVRWLVARRHGTGSTRRHAHSAQLDDVER